MKGDFLKLAELALQEKSLGEYMSDVKRVTSSVAGKAAGVAGRAASLAGTAYSKMGYNQAAGLVQGAETALKKYAEDMKEQISRDIINKLYRPAGDPKKGNTVIVKLENFSTESVEGTIVGITKTGKDVIYDVRLPIKPTLKQAVVSDAEQTASALTRRPPANPKPTVSSEYQTVKDRLPADSLKIKQELPFNGSDQAEVFYYKDKKQVTLRNVSSRCGLLYDDVKGVWMLQDGVNNNSFDKVLTFFINDPELKLNDERKNLLNSSSNYTELKSNCLKLKISEEKYTTVLKRALTKVKNKEILPVNNTDKQIPTSKSNKQPKKGNQYTNSKRQSFIFNGAQAGGWHTYDPKSKQLGTAIQNNQQAQLTRQWNQKNISNAKPSVNT